MNTEPDEEESKIIHWYMIPNEKLDFDKKAFDEFMKQALANNVNLFKWRHENYNVFNNQITKRRNQMSGLINGNFSEGWIDLPPTEDFLVNQQPNGWKLYITPPEENLPDGNSKALGIPECVHKLNSQLPPNEQNGGADELVLRGTAVYKIFHAGLPFSAELTQTIQGLTPGASFRFNVPVQVHDHSKVGLNDPWAYEVGIIANGATKWRNAELLPDHHWMTLTDNGVVGISGQVKVGFVVKSKWSVPVDFFVDQITFEVTNDKFPGDEEPPQPGRLALTIPEGVTQLILNIER